MGYLLLTGFEPWGLWSANPSGEVALALHGAKVGAFEVVSEVLPVAHGADFKKVAPMMAEYNPAAVISLGLHGSASALHVERVAVNLKVIDQADYPVVADGPDAYFATVPTRDMVGAMQAAGVPARLTYSAGTFLCNHIMYLVLHHIGVEGLDTKAGFIHLPPTPDLVAKDGRASMSLGDIEKGVRAGLAAVVKSLNILVV